MEVTPVQSEPQKSKKGLIIGIVVAVVLCCCCLLVGGGAAYYFYNVAQKTYSSINESLPEIPALPTDESGNPTLPEIPALPTDESGAPSVPGLDQAIPQGGLGDDILRADTWVYVMAGAAMSGCAVTDVQATSIEVLSQPDSAGVWQEKWTVTCDDSSKKAFEVTFTPGAQGGTDISVKESK